MIQGSIEREAHSDETLRVNLSNQAQLKELEKRINDLHNERVNAYQTLGKSLNNYKESVSQAYDNLYQYISQQLQTQAQNIAQNMRQEKLFEAARQTALSTKRLVSGIKGGGDEDVFELPTDQQEFN